MAKVRRHVGIFSLTALVLVSVFAIAQTAGAQQQNAPPSPWMQFTIVSIDPPMADEYVALQRDIGARIRRGQNAPAWRIVGRFDVFGDNYQFLTITPVQNLASFDARNADAELAVLNSRAQRYIKGQQSYGIRMVTDLANPLPERTAPAMLLINMAKVMPGREQDYLNLMKTDFLPHFDKAEFRHLTGTLTFGDESRFVHMFYINNFAKLDEGSPVVRALGPDAAQKVNAKMAGIVTGNESWTVRIVPDLSYGPWSPPASRQ